MNPENYTFEQILAARRLLQAKLRLWDVSLELERALGFDVDSGGDALEVQCSMLDDADCVTDENAIELLTALHEEQEARN